MNGEHVEIVSHFTYLGVVLTDDLNGTLTQN